MRGAAYQLGVLPKFGDEFGVLVENHRAALKPRIAGRQTLGPGKGGS